MSIKERHAAAMRTQGSPRRHWPQSSEANREAAVAPRVPARRTARAKDSVASPSFPYRICIAVAVINSVVLHKNAMNTGRQTDKARYHLSGRRAAYARGHHLIDSHALPIPDMAGCPANAVPLDFGARNPGRPVRFRLRRKRFGHESDLGVRPCHCAQPCIENASTIVQS